MIIRFEENVRIENAQFVCQWSNSLGKPFQEQWMGTMIPFPLIIQVLQDLEGIFSIFVGEEFVGIIQKIKLLYSFSYFFRIIKYDSTLFFSCWNDSCFLSLLCNKKAV